MTTSVGKHMLVDTDKALSSQGHGTEFRYELLTLSAPEWSESILWGPETPFQCIPTHFNHWCGVVNVNECHNKGVAEQV